MRKLITALCLINCLNIWAQNDISNKKYLRQRKIKTESPPQYKASKTKSSVASNSLRNFFIPLRAFLE